MIVFEAAPKEEVADLMAADPFVKEGVFKSWVIRPWNPLFVNRNLLPGIGPNRGGADAVCGGGVNHPRGVSVPVGMNHIGTAKELLIAQ